MWIFVFDQSVMVLKVIPDNKDNNEKIFTNKTGYNVIVVPYWHFFPYRYQILVKVYAKIIPSNINQYVIFEINQSVEGLKVILIVMNRQEQIN